MKANQVVIDLLARIGEQKDATPAQIALAWLLAQKPWIVPIPGSRKLEHLEENIGAVDVELAADDLREIENALSQITVQGACYPKDLAGQTGRSAATNLFACLHAGLAKAKANGRDVYESISIFYIPVYRHGHDGMLSWVYRSWL
jgi:hypothetical protein